MHDIRLGQKEPIADNVDEDLAIQDEETTSAVMKMISNLNESDNENSFNANNINTVIDVNDDEDEDNELISQLLSSNQI